MTVIAAADHGNIYVLAKQIAQSSTFQSVCGVSTTDEALERVHYPYVDIDEDGELLVDLEPPRAILSDELGEEEYVEGGMHTWTLQESFWLSFDFLVPTAFRVNDTKNTWAWFRQKVQQILKDMQSVGKTAAGITPTGGVEITYSALRAARRVEGPHRLAVAERDIDQEPEEGVMPEVWHVAYIIERGF